MITKTETREIFDRSKIGVGDIIEINKDGGGFLGNKTLYRHWAIVQRVGAEVVWIVSRENADNEHRYGIDIQQADEIRVIFRHPENV